MRRKSFLVASLLAIAALLAFSARASADPIIELDPTVHDFGDVEVGQVVDTMITVNNVGGHPLTVSSLFMMDGSDAAYTLVDPPATPFYVPAPDPLDPTANSFEHHGPFRAHRGRLCHRHGQVLDQ